MPIFHMTKAGNVVQCRRKRNEPPCQLSHYFGTYENALKWFGVGQDEPKARGDLFNIIIYQQLGGRAVPKLSSELFDILVQAQAEHKYWAPACDREENAWKALEMARDAGMLMDDLILKTLDRSDLKRCHDREYRHRKWLEGLDREW